VPGTDSTCTGEADRPHVDLLGIGGPPEQQVCDRRELHPEGAAQQRASLAVDVDRGDAEFDAGVEDRGRASRNRSRPRHALFTRLERRSRHDDVHGAASQRDLLELEIAARWERHRSTVGREGGPGSLRAWQRQAVAIGEIVVEEARDRALIPRRPVRGDG
jgi:hypothetical protein